MSTAATTAPRRTATPTRAAADQPARRVLWMNVAFTSACSAVIVVGADAVDEALGAGAPGWVRVGGLALGAFALLVAALARVADTSLLRRGLALVAVADAGWVIGSVVVLAAGWVEPAGAWAVTGIAVVIGALATAELVAWRRLGRG